MATEGKVTVDPVDDGEWVVFWTLAIVVLYFVGILALAGVGLALL